MLQGPGVYVTSLNMFAIIELILDPKINISRDYDIKTKCVKVLYYESYTS